jgi:hypothetical protein
MKGHSTKAYWAKKISIENLCSFGSKSSIVQQIKPTHVLIRYPCLICHQTDHKSMDYPRGCKVQAIL